MRLTAFALLGACTQVPAATTAYFQMQLCGVSGDVASTVRVYANGTQSEISEAGFYSDGISAMRSLPSPQTPNRQCSDPNTRAVFIHFDGNREVGVTEAVWRRAAGIPPFVDLPISPN